MELAINCKLVQFLPMTRGEYCTYRGWEVPKDEQKEDRGFLLETKNGVKNHQDHDGYITWLDELSFNQEFRKTSGLPFGFAVESLLRGKSVTRQAWMDSIKGTVRQRLVFVPKNENEKVDVLPNISLIILPEKEGEKTLVLQSYTPGVLDILATDWLICED